MGCFSAPKMMDVHHEARMSTFGKSLNGALGGYLPMSFSEPNKFIFEGCVRGIIES
jgi:hypothetical protein